MLVLPISFITYGTFQKKEFLNNELKENPFTVRIIGSNIGLERFYDNTQTENIINELVKISSPEKKKKIFFVWPEGIIPNTYLDELSLYIHLYELSKSVIVLKILSISELIIVSAKYSFVLSSTSRI